MLAVRFHGRGGQGVVTAAELLSVAAFDDGHHAQAFPSFGSERTGAPVAAFCRIDDHPIRTHEPIAEPDVIVVQDATLLRQIDVLGGLRAGGIVVVNTGKTLGELGLAPLRDHVRVLTVPATALALEHLGRPLPGAPLLAGLAAVTGVITLDALERAIRERFPGPLGEANVAAARVAYAEEVAHAPAA